MTREVRLLRLLSHPNIIKLECVHLPEEPTFNELYVQFELMENDLANVIRSSQPLNNAHFQYFIIQILSALAYMHVSSIMHRDLKPKNILVNSDCRVKVVQHCTRICLA